MWYLTVLMIAVGLAMDAFAVSLATGCGLKEKVRAGHVFRMAGAFGLFQAAMPVIGWLGGVSLADYLAKSDHWIAFGLLFLIGAKMVYEGIHGDECDAPPRKDPTRGVVLLLLALATSIDALAVGLSFGVTKSPIAVPALIIGVVCAGFSTLGLLSGRKLGCTFGKKMEIAGGAILILIGVKIAVEHIVKNI